MDENDSSTWGLRIPTNSRPIWYAIRRAGIHNDFLDESPRPPVSLGLQRELLHRRFASLSRLEGVLAVGRIDLSDFSCRGRRNG